MNKNSSWETSVKPVVVLSVIALIVSLLLAMVNSFTAPIIEENQKAATLAAYVDVMPTVSSASDLDEVTDYTTENITGAVKATDGSLAIKAEERALTAASCLSSSASTPTALSPASGWTLLPRPGHWQQRCHRQLPCSVRWHGWNPEHHPGPGLRRIQRRNHFL